MNIWLTASGLGVFFGSLPAWLSCSAMVLESVARDKKAVPGWLRILAAEDMYGSSTGTSVIPQQYYPAIFKAVAVGLAIFFLAEFHYLVRNDLLTGNPAHGLSIEMSFPLFFLMIWLLPTYFLRRYLRALPVVEGEVPKDEPKRNVFLFLAFVVLVCIMLVYFWLSQPISWRTIIFEVIPLVVLLYVAGLVALRAWRKLR